MSYGLELFDASGNLRLRPDETFTRIVAVEKLPTAFTGTVSVPNFDEAKGLFFVQFYMVKFSILTDTMLPDNDGMASTNTRIRVNPQAVPTLVWNNTTKLLTVTPHALPAGWETRGDVDPDYAVIFIHFR